MKIIGFTGAGGVGKSTIACKIGYNIPSIVDEIRKNIYGKNAKYGDLHGFEFISFQNLILAVQMHLEVMYKEKYKDCNDDILIPIERSSLDYAAYMLHLKDEDPDFYEENKEVVEKYVDSCVNHANTYDGIVYFPIDTYLSKEDASSSKERTYRSIKITDKYIRKLLLRINVPKLTLSSKDINGRVQEVIDYFK